MNLNDSITMYTLHTNYIGRIEKITDKNGNVADSMSYTPFGLRRSVTDWTRNDTDTRFTDRGFTGQQHLDNFALINFNGRMYDPVLAHFLSPDPYIQAPENPLNYNRYAYCLYSPLQYVDPSGDSIAILLAGNAVKGLGHMAVLVQDKDHNNKWFLYSKNGDDNGNYKRVSGEERGTKDDMGYGGERDNNVGFNSVQDFLNNTTENTEKHNGEGGTYYTQAYILPTTSEQDNIIRAGMVKKMNEDYNFFFNNCSQAVTYSLIKAGVNLFSPPIGEPMSAFYQPSINVEKGTIPIVTFEKIRMIHHGQQTLFPK